MCIQRYHMYVDKFEIAKSKILMSPCMHYTESKFPINAQP